MARKVFITVLGTGFYKSCKYVSQGFASLDTRFVQTATLEYIHAAQWTADDAALVLLTDGARKNNWEASVVERMNFVTKQPEPYRGLAAEIEKMNLPIQIKGLTIPDGKNEEEMWQIFKILYDALEEGDELYFDLTHSFRYLPMLVLVFGNYAKFLKKASVVHISYGNYEARDEQTNEAPIIDLLPLSALQDWTFAAASFLDSGNVSRLVDLCKHSLAPILRDAEKRNSNPSSTTLNSYVKALEAVVADMKGCRGISIIESTHCAKLMNLSAQLQQTIIEPLNPVLRKLKESFSDFIPFSDIRNGYVAAQWCFDHELYQQSLTILHENMVSHVCESEGIDWKAETEREAVNKAFKIYSAELPKEQWICAAYQKPIIERLLKNQLVQSLASIMAETTNLRNDYNHSGMRSNPTSTARIENKLEIQLGKIREFAGINKSINNGLMLINLSNHPYESWSVAQKQAAVVFGPCIDLPFPPVDAEAGEEIVEQLATEYLLKIEQLSQGKEVVVHLMGEMTLTFALVEQLRKRGISSLASTSERSVIEHSSGYKEVLFDFKRFRQYS